MRYVSFRTSNVFCITTDTLGGPHVFSIKFGIIFNTSTLSFLGPQILTPGRFLSGEDKRYVCDSSSSTVVQIPKESTLSTLKYRQVHARCAEIYLRHVVDEGWRSQLRKLLISYAMQFHQGNLNGLIQGRGKPQVLSIKIFATISRLWLSAAHAVRQTSTNRTN